MAKIVITLETVYGVEGKIYLDERFLGEIDNDLADEFASAITWALYGVIGNRKIQQLAETGTCQCSNARH